MSVKKDISYNTVGNVTALFGQWLIIMLIPMISDFSEAGVFAVAISVSSIMNQIAICTLNQYQVADQYEHYSENDYAVTRLITIAISFVCIAPVSLLFGYGTEQILIIVAYTVYRNIINYAYLHQSSLQIINHLDYAGKCMILEGVISFCVFITSYALLDNLLLSTSMMALAGGGVFIVSMSNGYKHYTGHRYGLSLKNRSNVVPLLGIGIPLMVSSLCPIIITALPKLILENQWGTEIVGYFSTLTSPTNIVPTLAQAIFIPFTVYFANLCKRFEFYRLKIQYGKILVALSLSAIIFYIASVLLAGKVFELIYGPEITPYVDYFNIMIVGIFLYTAGICGITVLITKKQGAYAGLSAIVSLLCSIFIFMLWIPSGGIDGATWGLVASYGIFGLLMTLCVYLIPLKPSSFYIVQDNNKDDGS